jgi:hypothetical protein
MKQVNAGVAKLAYAAALDAAEHQTLVTLTGPESFMQVRILSPVP